MGGSSSSGMGGPDTFDVGVELGVFLSTMLVALPVCMPCVIAVPTPCFHCFLQFFISTAFFIFVNLFKCDSFGKHGATGVYSWPQTPRFYSHPLLHYSLIPEPRR